VFLVMCAISVYPILFLRGKVADVVEAVLGERLKHSRFRMRAC